MTAEIKLNDAFKRFTDDQDKVLTPRETLDKFSARAADIGLDILAETRRIDTGRLDIPVFFSVCGRDARNLTGTVKQMGKGATPVQAEASAVMELVERFSFYAFSANPANFRVDTLSRLKNRAVDFDVLAKSVNDTADKTEPVRRFFSDLPLRWTQAYNLTSGESTLIPFDWFFTINQFNGTCAGNCNEEALCQGICEVVERHVCCDVGRHRFSVPGIRPESADQPAVREMLTKYDNAGIRFYFSDLTGGLGIPTVGMLAYDPVTFPQKSEIVWTAGTAPNPQKAMSRAMTETAQLAGDFDTDACYVASGLPKLISLAEAAFITETSPSMDINELPDISNPNIKIEVENCLAALAARDLDVYIINVTDSLLGLPAFYVIIPGTRFLQRAENASAGMFAAKLAAEQFPPTEAIGRLTEMKKLTGDAYYLSFYLGRCHLAAGETETALAYFYRALDQDPADQDIPSIYSYIGQGLKDLGRYQEALAALEKGLTFDHERTDILNLAGVCHFKLGEHERAVERFGELLVIDPSSAIDYANMAVNYRQLGDVERALYYYQQALTLDPSIEFARQHLEELLGQKSSR